MYIDVGVWLVVIGGLSGHGGSAISLDHFFSYRCVRWTHWAHGRCPRQLMVLCARVAQVHEALDIEWLDLCARLLAERAGWVRAATPWSPSREPSAAPLPCPHLYLST